MATLVLTTVGTLIGGPIGGAVGAALGSQIDRAVLTPGRKGPRLGELSVQTSSYGSAIPKIFGTMRVAGTVIWATDLREDTHRQGSKAGKTTTYSYSASLAVALSARPIRAVGRIWADGKLLRAANGGWRSETGFRLYLGGEDQPIDPLIASAQGIASTPAHRGIAYAVFDTLQLADFGNRVPSLSFEVIADEAPVPIARIAEELSGGEIGGAGGIVLGGYAASGDSVRGSLAALQPVLAMSLRDDGERLEIDAATIVTVRGDELGAGGNGQRPARLDRARRAASALPDEIAIGYYEPARDYQTGLQRARRDGLGARALQLELPATIAADQAKSLAEAALDRAWSGRENMTMALGWRYADARAGGRVVLDGRAWRIGSWTLEKMALTLKARPLDLPSSSSTAVPGATVGGWMGDVGETVLRLVDLPALGDGEAATPQIFAAAAGTGADWRRAELSLSLDSGGSWSAVGRTALPATMGRCESALPVGPRELFDERGSVIVKLFNPGMALQGTDTAGLLAGANLALIGDELVQFGRADQLDATRWRLSRLLRGRRGTDPAIAGHGVDEPFLLIEAMTLKPLDVPITALGKTLRVSAIGPGDAAAVDVDAWVIGRALRPPAPVALGAARLEDGTLRLRWTRRSRIGWAWLDAVDAPLGMDGERYRLTIAGAEGPARMMELSNPAYDYPLIDQVAAGLTGPVTASVVLLGAWAASPAISATWDI